MKADPLEQGWKAKQYFYFHFTVLIPGIQLTDACI